MAKYLATFSDTIGEIEINGFVTMTDKEMEHFEELASSITWDFVYQIGEEELIYSSGDDLLTKIDFREISNEEFKVIKKVFTTPFGTFINEDYLEGIIGEEIEEEDEDEDEYTSPKYGDDDDDEY